LGKESAARYESMRGTVESYMSTKHQALDVPSAGDESRREYASGIVEWQGVGTSGAVGGLRLRTWMLRRRADVELLADDERECRIRPRVRLSARAASSFVVPGQLFFARTFTASARLFHGNAKGVALTIAHDDTSQLVHPTATRPVVPAAHRTRQGAAQQIAAFDQ
jgi:hypothetical protein